MRILALSPCEAYPVQGGGTIVIYNDLLHLAARGHEIHLLALTTDPNADPSAMKDICTAEYFYKYKAPRWRRVLANIGSRYPFTVQHYVDNSMMEAARNALRKQKYDIILSEVLTTSPYGPPLREEFGVPFFIRGHNVDTQVLHRFVADMRNPLLRWLGHWQARKYAAYEGSILKQSDKFSMITSTDAAEAERLFPNLKSEVIDAGVDLDYFCPNEKPRERNLITHLGTYTAFTKLEAMIWFCREVLPLIRRKRPEATMELSGYTPPGAFDSFKGVTTLGRVDDPRPPLWRGRVFIAPQFVGSGVRLKILNAMATANAIVCTPVACEGIPLVDGEHALIRETPREMADAVLSVLADDDLADRLGRNARRLAEEKYRWETIVEHLERLMHTTIDDYRTASV